MGQPRDRLAAEDSRQKLEHLRRLGWYHSLELPGGQIIEGHQTLDQLRTRIRQFPIPEDLTGKRVLDIGAWDGWFSFEMERRGARVVAMDSARNTRFLKARELLGSRVEYYIGDICRLSSKDLGRFDIVLFLGVLYHLKHPILALENVCEMATELACVESFVADPDAGTTPLMEFYETNQLRGQFDNWVGPNTACLLAFCRTAGFARVRLESVLGDRAHVTCFRGWPPVEAAGPGPLVTCVENAANRDHEFRSGTDDYVAFYFASPRRDLNCDNVFPQVGRYGSRPLYVASTGGDSWQAVCKLPPGLDRGWHEAALRLADSAFSPPLRIGVDLTGDEKNAPPADPARDFRIVLVTDGSTWERFQIRVGAGSSVSLWTEGIAADVRADELRVRLNGTDLAATYLSPADAGGRRQVNALLPEGIEPGDAVLSLVARARESAPVKVELFRRE